MKIKSIITPTTTRTNSFAWSARCDCRNGHNSSSGRCNQREVTDPTRPKADNFADNFAACEDCRRNCPCGSGPLAQDLGGYKGWTLTLDNSHPAQRVLRAHHPSQPSLQEPIPAHSSITATILDLKNRIDSLASTIARLRASLPPPSTRLLATPMCNSSQDGRHLPVWLSYQPHPILPQRRIITGYCQACIELFTTIL